MYDNTNQLTADGTNTFSYDAEGNRTNTGYQSGTGNQLTSDGTWTYSYDNEGNLTKKTKGASAETWTYGYDNKNELTWVEDRATDGGTLQMRADYKYDVWGNRVEKDVDPDGAGPLGTTVTRFAYDGWNPAKPAPVGTENFDIWADLDGSNNVQTRYLRGDVVDQVFARIGSDGSAYWYLTDRQGSIRDITDNTGAVKDTLVYDGFGSITSETDSTYGGRYKWTGREFDSETNLQYNRARYYDGKTGRWISQDPLGLDAGDNNLYRYVRNAPVQKADSSGCGGRMSKQGSRGRN